MGTPLKQFFGRDVVEGLARDLAAAWPAFDARAFVRDAADGLDDKELLDRGKHVAAALGRWLPADFTVAADTIERTFGDPADPDEPSGMAPFRYMPYGYWVMDAGLAHFDR
jgi:hypothetical protein